MSSKAVQYSTVLRYSTVQWYCIVQWYSIIQWNSTVQWYSTHSLPYFSKLLEGCRGSERGANFEYFNFRINFSFQESSLPLKEEKCFLILNFFFVVPCHFFGGTLSQKYRNLVLELQKLCPRTIEIVSQNYRNCVLEIQKPCHRNKETLSQK